MTYVLANDGFTVIGAVIRRGRWHYICALAPTGMVACRRFRSHKAAVPNIRLVLGSHVLGAAAARRYVRNVAE